MGQQLLRLISIPPMDTLPLHIPMVHMEEGFTQFTVTDMVGADGEDGAGTTGHQEAATLDSAPITITVAMEAIQEVNTTVAIPVMAADTKLFYPLAMRAMNFFIS